MSTPNAVFHTLCSAQKPSELLCGRRGRAGDRGSHPDHSKRAEQQDTTTERGLGDQTLGREGQAWVGGEMPGARCAVSEPEPRWVRKNITALTISAVLMLT